MNVHCDQVFMSYIYARKNRGKKMRLLLRILCGNFADSLSKKGFAHNANTNKGERLNLDFLSTAM